jgi:hypothetical protein
VREGVCGVDTVVVYYYVLGVLVADPEGVCAGGEVNDLRLYTFTLAGIEVYLFGCGVRPAIQE